VSDRPPSADQSRYEGRPFLRLLDCYILAVIGELDAAQQDGLTQMQPKLQKTFNSSGTWIEIVEEQMDFMPTVPEKIREFWRGYREHVRGLGREAPPVEFVRHFVEQNFPHMLSDTPIQ
jgi:hypothetical protein